MISNDELTELFLDLATVEVFLCKWDENQMPTDMSKDFLKIFEKLHDVQFEIRKKLKGE